MTKKNSGSVPSVFGNVDSYELKTSTTDFSLEIPQREELTPEEAKIYSVVFDKEIGAPVETNKKLKECLSEFVEYGLHENEKYPKFIELVKKADDEGFDAVEKNRLHVINDDSTDEAICRHKTGGDWVFVASIPKSLVRKTYKNKNFGFSGSNLSGTTLSVDDVNISSGNISITGNFKGSR